MVQTKSHVKLLFIQNVADEKVNMWLVSYRSKIYILITYVSKTGLI